MTKYIRLWMVVFITSFFAIAPSVGLAQSEKDKNNNTLQADSSRANQSKSGSSVDEKSSWVNRFGVELDLSSGVMYRFPALTAGNIDVKAGILDRRVVDFSYERPLVKTDFSTKALAYQENTSHGIEKYTFGVDIGPIFKLLIPGEIPFLLRRTLSMRFRTEKELLQTQSIISENTLLVTEETELSKEQMRESDFTALASGSKISLRRSYNYFSADFPVFYFNSREYDFAANDGDPIHVDRLPGDQQSFLWIGTGIAKWNFVSTTRQKVSELGGEEVVVPINSEIWAANLEATFSSTNFEIGDSKVEHKFESITRAGYGFIYNVRSPDVDIGRFVDSERKVGFSEIDSGYFQTTLAWGVNLLSGSDNIKLYVTPRVTYRQIGTEISGAGVFYAKLNIDLTI